MRQSWPAVKSEADSNTYQTLHLWTQVVGKIALALAPPINHYWNVTLRFAPRGLVATVLPFGDREFTILFNFLEQKLEITCSNGSIQQFPLEPMTVADFYRKVMSALSSLGIDVHIWTMPVEVPNPIRFTEDTLHSTYNVAEVDALWQALLSMKPVFERFRCEFLGKCSPLHLFWGAFDLALTRFSGRRAPPRAGADKVTREAYSHEVISAGFWLGSGSVPEPAFYAYAAPQPEGFDSTRVQPAAAYYDHSFGEFVLPYEAVRSSATPEEDLRAFLVSTYNAGAELGKWERGELERRPDD